MFVLEGYSFNTGTSCNEIDIKGFQTKFGSKKSSVYSGFGLYRFQSKPRRIWVVIKWIKTPGSEENKRSHRGTSSSPAEGTTKYLLHNLTVLKSLGIFPDLSISLYIYTPICQWRRKQTARPLHMSFKDEAFDVFSM